jgi:hypothetical protein
MRALIVFVTLTCLPSVCFAQTEERPFQFIRTNSCQRCHKEAATRDAEVGITERVRMREWQIWQEHDKHASAYKVLTEPRSQRMGQLLGKNVLAKETGCVQCHVSNAVEELWSPDCFRNGQNLFVQEGVSCQACHGPASAWEDEHDETAWQQKTPAQKAEFGFNALEDPVRRASMCASCHIGNAELGRVITHEMYAAGHPMLSGFDMEAFADKMPRHWEYQEEKEKRLDIPAQPFKFERTRGVLVASVIGLQASVDLADEGKASWPELARLECYSCHHQLQMPSWRQESHVERFAGRPRLELGCLPILRVATQIATGSTQSFDAIVDESRDVFSSNMFGDTVKLAMLRTAVDVWSTKTAEKLANMPLDATKVEEILMLLIDAAAEGTHDYDTARQLTGAIYVVGEELKRSGAQVQGLTPLLTRLKTLEDSERGFALVSTEDKRVEDKFGLQLRNRAQFKPKIYAELLKSLRAEMQD